MSENVRATSFRISESAVERFKELASEVNMTQREFFDSLIGVYELESAKEKIVDRGKEIEEFQGHAQRLVSIFLNSLELNQNAETRIESKYQEALLKKNSAIEGLQAKLESEKSMKEYYRDENGRIEKDLAAMGESCKRIEEMNSASAELVSQYKEKVDAMSALVSEYKGFKDDIDRVKAELAEKSKLAEDRAHEIKDLQLQADSHREQVEFYKAQTAELKNEARETRKREDEAKAAARLDMEAERGKIKAEFEERLSVMLEKRDVEAEKALMEAKKGFDLEASKLKGELDRFGKVRESLENEISHLKEEVEKSRTKKQ